MLISERSLSITTNSAQVGQYTCTIIRDAMLECPTRVLADPSQWEEWEQLLDVSETGTVDLPVNCLLIESSDGCILVDTGLGVCADRSSKDNGRLLTALADMGLQPDDIDIVLLTHLHADHVDGTLTSTEDGYELVFPRARHIVTTIDATETLSESRENSLPEFVAVYVEAMRETFRALDSVVELEMVEPDATIIPGVRLMHTPGHTAGHCAVVVEDEGETLLYLADTFHFTFELSHPHLRSEFENDCDAVVESKHSAIEFALERDAIVGASHFFETFGSLRRGPDGVELKPIAGSAGI